MKTSHKPIMAHLSSARSTHHHSAAGLAYKEAAHLYFCCYDSLPLQGKEVCKGCGLEWKREQRFLKPLDNQVKKSF